METQTLFLYQITLLADIQIRVSGVVESVVATYVAVMQNGGEMPPLQVVLFDDGSYVLADGFHRFEAMRRLQMSSVICLVHRGDYSDALRLAIVSNHGHGLALTNADKRETFFKALQHQLPLAQQSDRAIAAIFGVHHSTIADWRKAFVGTSGGIPPVGNARLGRDGKTRVLPRLSSALTDRTPSTLDTQRTGSRPAQEPSSTPSRSFYPEKSGREPASSGYILSERDILAALSHFQRDLARHEVYLARLAGQTLPQPLRPDFAELKEALEKLLRIVDSHLDSLDNDS